MAKGASSGFKLQFHANWVTSDKLLSLSELWNLLLLGRTGVNLIRLLCMHAYVLCCPVVSDSATLWM